jgi:sulfate/thiosulfate-binding protein
MPGFRQLFASTLLVMTALTGCGQDAGEEIELLNVSYDPTRELWRDINERFTAEYERDHDGELSIHMSHGGSSSQARAVIDGLEADVVTLATHIDTNQIAERDLIRDGWEDRLPNRSLPYFGTLVFVVRRGNPKNVRDWPDLVRGDIEVVTPNPKTSGNGYLTFFSAWGSVVLRGGSDADATTFVTELYRRVPVLDSGARGATTTFSQRGIGDVHIAWENEAHLEVEEANGQLEIIYPPISIRAEPHVAVVDANVDRRHTRAVAEAYLEFLYTAQAQEIIAQNHYRPNDETVLARHRADFPEMRLFAITEISPDGWQAAHRRFIAEGGVFDRIYRPGAQ